MKTHCDGTITHVFANDLPAPKGRLAYLVKLGVLLTIGATFKVEHLVDSLRIRRHDKIWTHDTQNILEMTLSLLTRLILPLYLNL